MNEKSWNTKHRTRHRWVHFIWTRFLPWKYPFWSDTRSVPRNKMTTYRYTTYDYTMIRYTTREHKKAHRRYIRGYDENECNQTKENNQWTHHSIRALSLHTPHTVRKWILRRVRWITSRAKSEIFIKQSKITPKIIWKKKNPNTRMISQLRAWQAVAGAVAGAGWRYAKNVVVRNAPQMQRKLQRSAA